MKYNLNNPIDQEKFKKRCNELYEQKKMVELRVINQNRTLPQNAYLHVLLGKFAMDYGETIEFVKQEFFKKAANKDLFYRRFQNRITLEERDDWRSTAALDKDEMTLAINRFRDWSIKEANIYLPSSDEREFLAQVQIDMQRQQNYI